MFLMKISFSVDGAIHAAAGKFLCEENKMHGKCKVGQAVISGGYKLPAKCKFYRNKIIVFKDPY